MPARRRLTLASLLALSLSLGCAGDQGPLKNLFGALIGSHISVGFPAAVPVPDEVTLDLGIQGGEATRLGQALFSAVTGETLEQKVGKAIKNAALPVRSLAAGSFRSELEKSQLFGKVTDQGGDLMLSLGVPRWGLRRDPASGKVEPIFDMEASLALPGFGTVWKATRSAAQVSQALKSKGFNLGLELVASRPKSLGDALALVATDLSQQMVEDLRKNPPQRKLLNF